MSYNDQSYGLFQGSLGRALVKELLAWVVQCPEGPERQKLQDSLFELLRRLKEKTDGTLLHRLEIVCQWAESLDEPVPARVGELLLQIMKQFKEDPLSQLIPRNPHPTKAPKRYPWWPR